MKDSLVTGIGAGAVVGAAGSSATYKGQKKGKAAISGALIGAAIGGLTSYFIHDGLKKRDAKTRRETIFNLDKHNVSAPRGYQMQGNHGITMPVVEGEVIEEHVSPDGKRLIESHRIWHIKEDAQWVPTPGHKKK